MEIELDEEGITAAREAWIKALSERGSIVNAIIRAYLPYHKPQGVGITEEDALRLKANVGSLFALASLPQSYIQRLLIINDLIDSLTHAKPQGFMPDWSEACDGDVGICCHYTPLDRQVCLDSCHLAAYFPRPTPARMTTEEIEEKAWKHATSIGFEGEWMKARDFANAVRNAYLAKKAGLIAANETTKENP